MNPGVLCLVRHQPAAGFHRPPGAGYDLIVAVNVLHDASHVVQRCAD